MTGFVIHSIDGVHPNDIFAIDENNLYEKLGLRTWINPSTNFYSRVYDDEKELVRSILSNSKKEDVIQKQYEFFTQRTGGPPLFIQKIKGRHFTAKKEERIRRMQSVFNRERNKYKRSYGSWQEHGPGAYHQHFQRNDWYWKVDIQMLHYCITT